MPCWSGFGNLLSGKHRIWIADFTGAGHAQVMFYFAGDGNWWLGDMAGGQLQWTLVSQSAGFGNLLSGQHQIWIADFTGAGHAQVMFYFAGDGNWWLGDMAGGQLQWTLVSQSAGFGNLLSGQHQIWIADFTGAGHAQVMFYFAGDGNWWLGDMAGGQLQWTLVSQSAGFGNLLSGQHQIWIADFTGAGHAQVMFYFAGDGNWWLGDMAGGQLQWTLVSQSAGFGNLLSGKHRIWIADFTGAGHAQVMFYFAGDGNWWLGDMAGGQLQWTLVSQSAGFGNLLSGQHQIWIADFTGAGHAQVMFYFAGDGNWWLGDMAGGQLQWTLVSQSAGFGNLLSGKHRIWIADFTGAGHAQVMFYFAGDGNWWLGDMAGGQLQWTLVSQSAGFGNLLSGQHQIWIADFTGAGHAQVMFYFAGDGNWWLGDMAGGQLQWNLVGNTGRPHNYKIRILLKIVQAPTVPITTLLANMQQVYDTADILVEEGPREDLVVIPTTGGAPQLIFSVGLCQRGQTPTADQTLLFGNRNNAAASDIVVYFVTATTPPLNGCAAFPAGRPGAIVTQGASPWTLAHEVGHVLGLDHITGENTGCPAMIPLCCSTPDFTRLMTGCGTGNIIGTPVLVKSEIATMQASSFTRRC